MIVSATTLLRHLSVSEPQLPRKPFRHLRLSHDRICVRSLCKIRSLSLAVLIRRVII